MLGDLELRREMLGEEGDVRGVRGIDDECRLVNAGIERQRVARVCRGRDRFALVDLNIMSWRSLHPVIFGMPYNE